MKKTFKLINSLIILMFIFTTTIFANTKINLPDNLPTNLEQDYIEGYITEKTILYYDEQGRIINEIIEYYSFK
ncbi:MAG: hypothetical protein ACK5LT_06010 [Lachnospirales bacterium]